MYIDYKLIGKRIKEERKKKCKTQEQLAEQLSVTVGYVSQLERGYTKINLEMLAKICLILECDMVYLITGTAYEYSSSQNDEILKLVLELTESERILVIDIMHSIIKNR